MRKRIPALLCALFLLGCAAPSAQAQDAPARAEGTDTPSTAMEIKRIAVQTGTINAEAAMSVMPDLEVDYYNSQADCLAALRSEKADAYASDEPIIRHLMNETAGLAIYGGKLDESSIAAAFARTDAGRALCDRYSAFVDELWANGTMAEIDALWFEMPDDQRTLGEYEALPDTNGTLRMAADPSMPPFAYVKDNRIVGYDVDIAARFCEANGLRLEVVPMDFAAVLPAVQTGKCDFASGCITVTRERAENVLFSSPSYHSGTVLAVMKEDLAQTAREGAYTHIDQVDGARIAVQTGTLSGQMCEEAYPNAKVLYYDTQTDSLAALKTGKADVMTSDEPVLRFMQIENPQLRILEGNMGESNLAAAFARTEAGQALCDQYSAFVDKLWADGTMKEIDAVWFGRDDSKRTVLDYENLPAPNGRLHMATDLMHPPFAYMKDGRAVGYDLDVAARFCQENGYGLVIESMSFGGMLPAVQSGKADFASCSITVTKERAESVLFSTPDYYGGISMAVWDGGAAAAPADGGAQDEDAQASGGGGIAESFNKTFVREDRWRLFLDGVLTTLLITLLAILFGTLLGFGVFMLCRNGNPAANLITRFCLWLVRGMPMVVLLMILYYIVFGSLAISGVFVAVIGFTLTFGASVFGLLKMGVGAVDNGQYEAAYALGYSNTRTFFKVILPQALPHVLPAYKGEIVSLIKATAVVGYIAVQDLTKMGDIVRSRTYEAFFPLIAVTVIYFLLEGLIGFLVSRISLGFNPERRSQESILKGVKTDD